jgi:hypothetical protein
MTHRSAFIPKALFITLCLTLGCSKIAGGGCNGNNGASPAEATTSAAERPTNIDSKLLGVYAVSHYQTSREDTCEQLTNIPAPPRYVVLYGFKPKPDGDEMRLGGAFCEDVELCRAYAKQATEPPIGYSFISGDDASGWQGWAIIPADPLNDRCAADVQSHRLTSKEGKAIKVETKTVRTLFAPSVEGGLANCQNRDAIDAVTDDLPCKALLILEATFEGAL